MESLADTWDRIVSRRVGPLVGSAGVPRCLTPGGNHCCASHGPVPTGTENLLKQALCPGNIEPFHADL